MRACRPLGLCLASAISWGSCSEDQAAAPSPPGSSNRPPVIQSISGPTNRAEVGADVELAAVVVDEETEPSRLDYRWAATGGTLSGTGASVRWRAPVSATPSAHLISLIVVEQYTSAGGGRPQLLENRATETASVYVNNSPAELTSLAFTFVDDFVHPGRTPAYAVRNFSDHCRGKSDEFGDIVRNRAEFIIDPEASTFSLRSISFNTAGNVPAGATAATVRLNCHFVSTRRTTGVTGPADGICRLTNVYEDFRWRLCESLFDPPAGTTTVFVF